MKKVRPWLGWLVAAGAVAFAFRGCVLPDPKPPAPPIGLPAQVKAVAGEAVEIVAETKAPKLSWEYLGDGKSPQLLPTGNPKSIWFVSAREGIFRVRAEAVIDGEIAKAETKVIVGTPPVPPDPGPDPPDPGPVPPVPVTGLHVMIIYDPLNIDPSLRNKMMAKEVVDYLSSKGGNWRCWAKDVDASNEDKKWQDLFARAKSKMNILPWVVISNGKSGYEGPLPVGSKEDILALYKKFGG